MSLILDALRKIEQERKTRRQGGGDVRAELLSYAGAARKPDSSPALPLLTVALLLAAAAVALLLWRMTLTPSVENQPAVQAAVTPQPPGEPTAPTVTQPPVLSRPGQASAPVHPATAPPLPPKAGTTPATSLPPAQSHKESGTAGAGESLVVSGIAWQEEKVLRRAVVNGSLVGEGGEISGARVMEIRENRVRFSRGGRSFEVEYAGGGR